MIKFLESVFPLEDCLIHLPVQNWSYQAFGGQLAEED